MAITKIDSRPLGPQVFVSDETDDIDTAIEVIKLGAMPGDLVVDTEGLATYVVMPDKSLQQIADWSNE